MAGDFPGTIVGSPDFFSLLTFEPAEALRDKEPRRVLFARRDGEDVGFIGLRREHKWDHARPSGTVTVGTFCGTPAARLAIARRIVDLDLMGTTKLENIGSDDPLLDWVGGPRATGDLQTWDSTWVRLVDLEAAWPLRSYEADCDVVVEVEDRYAPWNAGRWRLTASSGAGTASRTDDPADVTLDVNVLGEGFLGHGIGGLLRAGVVREHRAGRTPSWRGRCGRSSRRSRRSGSDGPFRQPLACSMLAPVGAGEPVLARGAGRPAPRRAATRRGTPDRRPGGPPPRRPRRPHRGRG